MTYIYLNLSSTSVQLCVTTHKHAVSDIR